jgi:LuxR family maltose regulon positive regulatory protein
MGVFLMGDRAANPTLAGSTPAPLSPGERRNGHVPRTKLVPPAWARGHVLRDRLIDRLDRAVEARLVAVAGPAGSGKTISLAQHYGAQRERRLPIAWFTLDKADCDPALLLAGLFQALETVLEPAPAGLLDETLELLAADPTLVARRLLDWQALTELQPWIVIDAYEAISGSPSAILLDAWIRIGVSRLIVAGRVTPDLPLSLMRARGEVDEIGPRDLAFDAVEMEALAGGRVPPLYLDKLLRETDGTPVVTCHAMRSLDAPLSQRPSLTARSWTQALQEYYREQLRHDLRPELWRLVCRLSMVEVFDVALASGVNGAPAGEMIRELHSVHGLVTQDPKTRFYRLPRGLRSALASELQWIEEDESRRIHAQAANWFSNHGLADHAALHAVAANDPRLAAAYIAKVGSAALSARFGFRELRHGLSQLSDRDVAGQPVLSRTRALVLAQEAPGQLAGEARSVGQDSDPEAAILDAYIISYRDERPDEATVERCRELALVENIGRPSRGLARCFLCWEAIRSGRLADARRWGDRALEDFETTDAGYAAAFVHMHASVVAFYENDLDQARSHVGRAEQIAKLFFPDDERLFNLVWVFGAWLEHDLGAMLPPEDLAASVAYGREGEGWLDPLWMSTAMASRQALRRGDVVRARDFIERGLDTAQRRGAARLSWALRSERVRLRTFTGDLDAASHEAGEIGLYDLAGDPLHADPLTWRDACNGWINAARLQVRLGDREAALRTCAALHRFAVGHAIPRLAAAAAVLRAGLDDAGAESSHAFARASFKGAVSVALFADEGARTDLQQVTVEPPVLLLPSQAHGAHGLTTREAQLMAHLARGLVNKQIAYELGVSETTIKFHMRNIYRKLGARNRVQALMRMASPAA